MKKFVVAILLLIASELIVLALAPPDPIMQILCTVFIVTALFASYRLGQRSKS